MKSPGLTVATDANTATGPAAAHPRVPAQAGVVISSGGRDDAVERAFAAAARDPARLDGLLEALRLGRLWLPLPDDGRPVTDGSAVHLPTMRYLGATYIPAYTSATRLLQSVAGLGADERASVVPHALVGAADLARRLPPALGIALNPGGPQSVPIYPAGVAWLAAERATVAGARIAVGPLPAPQPDLLVAIAAALGVVRPAREATAAWLTVEQAGAGLVIAVTLDDPADAAARDAAVAAVQRAVLTEPALTEAALTEPTLTQAVPTQPVLSQALQDGVAVDVTFPGEGEPDVIDRWVAGVAAPFYQRAVPAPRPARD